MPLHTGNVRRDIINLIRLHAQQDERAVGQIFRPCVQNRHLIGYGLSARTIAVHACRIEPAFQPASQHWARHVATAHRSEENTSEIQSILCTFYADLYMTK